MRIVKTALIFAVSFICALPLYAQEKFPFKSAVVKYKITGQYQNGVMDVEQPAGVQITKQDMPYS